MRLASCPRDWSAFAGIDLWIYNPHLLRAPLYLTIGTENPKTKEADAYSHRIDLNTWTGWRHLTIPFTKMNLVGAPRGWNQIDGLRIDAFDWATKPNPEAVVYVDDVRLVTRDQIRGPRMTDQDFFAAIDLARPGLEQVAAAVAAGDYPRAKSELLAYYRARPNPTGRGERRPGPRTEQPTLAALTSWNGFRHSLTVDWTGWKRLRLTKSDFKTVHRPLGWTFIRYVAFTLDGPGQKSERETPGDRPGRARAPLAASPRQAVRPGTGHRLVGASVRWK